MKYIGEGDWEPYFDQDGVKEILDFVAGAGGNFVFCLWIFFTFYKVVCSPKPDENKSNVTLEHPGTKSWTQFYILFQCSQCWLKTSFLVREVLHYIGFNLVDVDNLH